MFQKIWGIEKFLHNRGYHNFPSKIFVSQGRKILWASLQCFRKFGISKNFMHNRGYHNFSSKSFCLTVPKNFVMIPSMFQKNWGIEKFLHNRGYHNFPSKIFVSQGPTFCGHPFNVSENLGFRKILCIIGGITIFRRKVFVSQCRKISWWSLQCFRKIGVSKNFMHNRGYHNFLSHSAEKFYGHPFNVSENFL